MRIELQLLKAGTFKALNLAIESAERKEAMYTTHTSLSYFSQRTTKVYHSSGFFLQG
jgi:hypothetical protein